MTMDKIRFTTLPESNENLSDKSFNYWNNEEIEIKKKTYNVIEDYNNLLASKKNIELKSHFETFVKKFHIDPGRKKILSVASGVCWIEAIWFEKNNPDQFIGIDFSKNRIHKLAPIVFANHHSNYQINLINGNIYDLNEGTEKFDIIILIKGFHHINDPVRLLKFLSGISHKETEIVIIGEHLFNFYNHVTRLLKHYGRYILNHNNYRSSHSFFATYEDLFPPSILQGDNHYSKTNYYNIFDRSGSFDVEHFEDYRNLLQSFRLKFKK